MLSQPRSRRIIPLLTFAGFALAVLFWCPFSESARMLALAQTSQPGIGDRALVAIDVSLPSESTSVPSGALAIRVHTPRAGAARYPDGAPIIIWVLGGFEIKGINHGLPPVADDVICITFIYPGGEDPWSGRSSDGVYDYRGEAGIAALRDVILYAAGELRDADGKTIDEIVPVPVLHDNIGMIGESNGGNILVAVAALHGEALAGRLRYVIQWETPVSSQIATRDLGRVWLKPATAQGDYWNPRYLGYDPLVLPVDYTDLVFDPTQDVYPVIHDGNGDSRYTTVRDPRSGLQVPDLNLDGILDLTEDFPLDTYPVDDERVAYSRPVMGALEERSVFGGAWPEGIVRSDEAAAFWDLREAVLLYPQAMANIPDLEAMVLCGVRDHVQALPDKPHIRQAFDGWDQNGAWVRINPSREHLIAVDPTLAGRRLPDLPANTAPDDWTGHDGYAIPVDVPKPIYQLAGVYEMADRIYNASPAEPDGALVEPSDGELGPVALPSVRGAFPRSIRGGVITAVESDGIGWIAVEILSPSRPRYDDGAPVIVNVSGFFTGATGFKYELDPDAIGAIYVTYLWPGQTDRQTGAVSEGIFDYGGPDCLRALRDVARFATGEIPDIDGRYLHELTGTAPLYNVAGLYAFSHSGIAAANVLALHGEDLQQVRFFVGRENPTIDEMYPLESGHWDDETGRAVHNPFYDPSGYTPTSIAIDYSSVEWSTSEERPFFVVPDGADYFCSAKHPRMWGKDYWSTGLLQALLDNGSLTRETWPETLATPEEAARNWPFRTTVDNYPRLAEVLPDLKVMLVFAADDHVQAAIDKPHIHQAFDGFRHRAGLWCRMNPDLAYTEAFIGPGSGAALPDNPADAEPADWMRIRTWGYLNPHGANLNRHVAAAAVAEMCDRTYYDAWAPDLTSVLAP